MFNRVVLCIVVGLVLLAPAAAAIGSEGAGGGINPLAPEEIWLQRDLAIWTAVVFLVLLAILWKFAWGPIADGLDKRERGIADNIDSAKRRKEESEQLLAEYEKKLAAAGDDVRRILDEARRDAERSGRQIVEQSRADSKAQQERAVREIETATAGALKDLAERSADMAGSLAGKIVRAELRPDDHAELVQQAVADFVRNEPDT